MKKLIKKLRYITVPKVTYGTRRLLWQHFHQKLVGHQMEENLLR